MKATGKPIILMYHGTISGGAQIPADREPGAGLYDVAFEDFLEHIEYLKNYNYRVTTIGTEESLEKAVIITFDDGEMNNFQNAFPVLKESGYPAYFFVTVKRIGKSGYMGWEELRRIRDAGMMVGSHGLNHEILTDLTDKKLEEELEVSKMQLEQNLKIQIDDFSVPRGFYDERILAKAEAAGYKNIFVSGKAPSDRKNCFGRIAVRGSWSVRRFDQALLRRMPLSELVVSSLKSLTKRVMGAQGYDRLRTTLLRARR